MNEIKIFKIGSFEDFKKIITEGKDVYFKLNEYTSLNLYTLPRHSSDDVEKRYIVGISDGEHIDIGGTKDIKEMFRFIKFIYKLNKGD